jgi:hypothetical protein
MGFEEFLGVLPRFQDGIQGNPGWSTFGLELLFWVVVVLLTVALVRFQPALLEKAEARLRRTSQFERFWLIAFGLGVIFVRLALLPLIPIPVPKIHDEFSFLLAADTFSHGRLTNFIGPMWPHFESFHINMQPSYQSMYPPAQGIALAFGKVLTGIPWTGVLITTALMCSAIYWMLLGWLPAPWAWLGGAFACARFGIFSYWMNSYYGGSVAALGGAIVLGALPRFRQKPTVRIGLIMAVGLLILANSRPLEGFLFSLPILISVALILMENGKTDWLGALKTVLPAMALLALGSVGMLYYNWRGTGNALLMPYVVNWNTYHITEPFFFQKPNPIPHYRHLSMRTFYVAQEIPGLLISKYAMGGLAKFRAGNYYLFYLWPLSLVCIPCIYALCRSQFRVALISLALVTADLVSQTWPPQPHYASPALGAIFLILFFSLRYLRSSQHRYVIWGSRAAAIVLALWMISPIAESLWDPYRLRLSLSAEVTTKTNSIPMPLEIQRQRIQATLEGRGGKHLVIVHYPAFDDPSVDWVYNDADLDRSSIIWARDMGYGPNEELVNYYPGRQVWYVIHGDPIVMLSPYERDADPLNLALAHSPSHSPSETARPSAANALQQVARPPIPNSNAKPQVSAILDP